MKESLSDNQRVYHPVENYDQLKRDGEDGKGRRKGKY